MDKKKKSSIGRTVLLQSSMYLFHFLKETENVINRGKDTKMNEKRSLLGKGKK